MTINIRELAAAYILVDQACLKYYPDKDAWRFVDAIRMQLAKRLAEALLILNPDFAQYMKEEKP